MRPPRTSALRAATAPSLLSLGAAAAVGVGYAWVEARSFALRRLSLPVLPEGTAPLRVLHVSDMHILPRQHRKIEWVRRLGDLDVDLVVSTGDSIAGPDAVEAALRAQEGLLRRPGVFVLGSNDHYAPKLKNPARYLLPDGGRRRILGDRLPTEDLVKGFLDAGWHELANRRLGLEVGGVRLEFVGVADPHLGQDRYQDVAGPADPGAAVTIGVTHAPYRRVLDGMTADGAGLLLAGHTHGGQLCLPLVGALVTNCDLPRRRAKGLSRWSAGTDSAWLHVSAGIGTPPQVALRFACRPEASLLTLLPRRR